MSPVTARPFVFWLTTPARMIDIPSVVITALTPTRVIRSALKKPTSRPRPSPKAITTGTLVPSASAVATKTAERPAIAPTERSNS
jgi:hypothetical protein